MEIFKIKTPDNHTIPIFFYKHKPENQTIASIPKAIIQVIHGMSEHHEYYSDFIKYFTTLGYDIYLYDQRGHGQAVDDIHNLGYISDADGMQKLIDDAVIVSEYAKRQSQLKYSHSNQDTTIPFFLFGHSMGSAVALSALYNTTKNHKKYYDLLLSTGSPGVIPNWQAKPGRLIINFESKRQKLKSKAISPLTTFIINYGFNLPFLREKHPFAWSTQDKLWQEKITADPKAAFIPQNIFWLDLFSLLENVKNPLNFDYIPNQIPLAFMTGANDTISNKARQVNRLVQILKQEHKNIIMNKIYPNTRHHLCLEPNRLEIFKDMQDIFEKYCKNSNTKNSKKLLADKVV